jgi:hypothetical protein
LQITATNVVHEMNSQGQQQSQGNSGSWGCGDHIWGDR